MRRHFWWVAFGIGFGLGVLCGCRLEGQAWKKVDTGLATVATAVWSLDAWQTMSIQRMHDGSYETNRILGRHPSDAAVVAYFGTAIAATWTVPRLIHNKVARRLVLAAVIVNDLTFVIHNRQVGVRLSW